MQNRTRGLVSIAGVATLLLWAADANQTAREVEAEGRTVVAAGAKHNLRTVHTRTAGPESVTTTPGAAFESAYIPGELRVRVTGGADLEAIAKRHGLTVLRGPGRSGMALLGVPPNGDPADATMGLRADPEVASVGSNGRIAGATEGTAQPTVRSLQWHVDMIAADRTPATGLSNIVVAVVDSGVAYTTTTEGGQAFSAAPSLAGSVVVAPYDFVENDLLPLDENQHGTHIASSILGTGQILGTAPGAKLMPLRVLDEDNQGSEYGLIEALYHAADNGADVINMSLSFHPDYQPSVELVEALAYARASGCVMLAAAGNMGLGGVTWPAASPEVMGVGSFTAGPQFLQHGTEGAMASILSVPGYSNLGAGVDIMAPGGDLGHDYTGDGYPDGILAETINPANPAEIGYWFMEGTSQATALTSGVVAQMLAAGKTPSQIQQILRQSGQRYATDTVEEGWGGGFLDVERAVVAMDNAAVLAGMDPNIRVGVVGWYTQSTSTKIRALADVLVTNPFGDPLPNLKVQVEFRRASSRSVRSCTTNASGICRVTAPEQASALFGLPVPAAITYEVAAVGTLDGTTAIKPEGVYYATEALEVQVAAADASSIPDDYLIAMHWSPSTSGGMGTVVESWTLPAMGSGLATSPLGVIWNQPALDLIVNLSGSGLATSPLGLLPGLQTVNLSTINLNLDGTGLATSPLGILPLPVISLVGGTSSGGNITILGLEGTGLATSPLGFLGTQPFLGGGGANLDGLNFNGSVMVDGSTSASAALSGTSIGERVEAGGFVTSDGRDGAHAVSVSVGGTSGASLAGSAIRLE
jgi:hypothetical protein